LGIQREFLRGKKKKSLKGPTKCLTGLKVAKGGGVGKARFKLRTIKEGDIGLSLKNHHEAQDEVWVN